MSDEQGTHFWFMSLILPNAAGFAAYRRVGHCTPEPGATRLDLFDMLLNMVKEKSPELNDGAVVISFDIQPNKL